MATNSSGRVNLPARLRSTQDGGHAVPAAMSHVVDLIFGRWRSQILYAGVALDVFAHLSPDTHRSAAAVASDRHRSDNALPPFACSRHNRAACGERGQGISPDRGGRT